MEVTASGEEPYTYSMASRTAGGPRNYPVVGCLGQAATRLVMWVHFSHRHVWDNIIILEEGNLPHPQFSRCDILVPWRAMNGRNLATAQFSKGTERKCRRLAEEELRNNLERDFQAYLEPLETVTLFKYLLTVGDDDWTAVSGNLRKARKTLVWIKTILSRRGWTHCYQGYSLRRSFR